MKSICKNGDLHYSRNSIIESVLNADEDGLNDNGINVIEDDSRPNHHSITKVHLIDFEILKVTKYIYN